MLRFKKAKIKNARVYKDVEVTLEHQGIVSVKGKNGAGKSTLFNLIESTFFGSMPNGDKKNDLVKGKGNSSIAIECEKNGLDYVIEQKRTKGKWKYVILENGEDVTPHKQTDQLKKIESILDFTQKEFQGSVHLTQNGCHILIKGKPQARKEYISDFFNMDSRFDEVKEEAKAERAGVKKRIEKLNALSQTRETLNEDFEELELMDETKLKEDLSKAEKAKAKLKEDLDTLKENLKISLKYEELKPIADSIENPEEEFAKTENKIAELKAIVSQADLVQEYNTKATLNNINLQKNLDEIENLKVNIPEDWAKLGYEYLVDFNNKLEFKKENSDKVLPLLEELKSLKDVAEIDVADLEKYVEEETKRLNDIKHEQTVGIEVAEIKEKISNIPNYSDVDLSVNYQEQIEQTNAEIFKLENKQSEYLKIKPLLDELDTYPAVSEVDLTKAEEDYRNVKNQKDFLQNKITAVQNGQCPTCGAEHSSDNLQSDYDLLEQYKKSEKEFEDYINAQKGNNKVAQRRSQIISLIEGVESFTEEDLVKLNKLKSDLASLKEMSSKTEEARRAMQERELLLKQIEGKKEWTDLDQTHFENAISDLNAEIEKLKEIKANNEIARRRKVILAQTEGKEVLTEVELQQYNVLQDILPMMKKLGDLERLVEGKNFEELKEDIDATKFIHEEKELKEKLDLLKKVLNAKENLPEGVSKSSEDIKEELDKTNDKLSKVEDIFLRINQDLAVVDQNNKRYLKLKKQIHEMDEKIEELPELAREEYFWKTMEDAYGPKGLRVNHLDNIMKLIMGRLPIYTNYLFEEDMEFFHKCESGQIEIFVRRTDDKGETYEYDIASMSGGETKKLSIAFMLAMSDAVPRRKRCNILIVDEVDSPLDADSRYMFINELLPNLSKDYESIFVISHSTESAQANVFDKTWMIENQPDQWTTISVQ